MRPRDSLLDLSLYRPNPGASHLPPAMLDIDLPGLLGPNSLGHMAMLAPSHYIYPERYQPNSQPAIGRALWGPPRGGNHWPPIPYPTDIEHL